mgnify:FL=1
MKVAGYGATGAVGKLFCAQALEAGHGLTVLVRDRKKFEHSERPEITVIEGNATNLEDVTRAVESADVVVSCLGNVAKARIMASSFDNILTAAAAQPAIPRCLMITSLGCGGSSRIVKILLALINGRASWGDYEKADSRVRSETNVPCVLIRPSALRNKPGTGNYSATNGKIGLFAKPIPRSDLARFLLDAATDDQWDGTGGVQLSGT